MVHKSDLSWTAKVNNPSDLYHKGDDVEAIILSINHDEKKVSLGVKQLWDDPWPTIFTELPPGSSSKTQGAQHRRVRRLRAAPRRRRRSHPAERARSRRRTRRAKTVLPKIGDEVEAEIANIDSQERRLTLSMRRGEAAARRVQRRRREGVHAAVEGPEEDAAAAEAAAGGTIGELIKQKLGAKLAQISTEKKDDDEDEDNE